MTFERDPARAAGGPENYYDVLGLTPGASDEEIEAAYTDLSGMFAADRVPAGRQDYARRQRARLAAAYGALAEPDSRNAYDARLGIARPGAAGPVGAPAPPAEPAGWAPPVPEPLSAGDAYAPTPAAPEAAPAPLPSAMTYAPATEAEAMPASPAGSFGTDADLEEDEDQAGDEDEDEDQAGDEDEDEDRTYDTEDDLALEDEQATDGGRYDDGSAEEEDDADERYDETDETDEEDADERYDDEELEDTVAPPLPAPVPPAPRTAAPAARPGAAAATGAVPAARVAPAGPRGGIALPSRREAAQITARAPIAPAAPAPAARPATRVSRPIAPMDERSRRIRTRPAPPPPARKRRKADTNRFAYQVMTLVIGLVLVLGTVASVLSGTIQPGTDTTAPQLTATPSTLGPVAQAQALESQRQWALAQQLYQQALTTDPQNVQALVGLARVYRDQQPPDPAKAMQYAQEVVRLAPNSAQATEARTILAQVSVMSTATEAPPATSPTP